MAQSLLALLEFFSNELSYINAKILLILFELFATSCSESRSLSIFEAREMYITKSVQNQISRSCIVRNIIQSKNIRCSKANLFLVNKSQTFEKHYNVKNLGIPSLSRGSTKKLFKLALPYFYWLLSRDTHIWLIPPSASRNRVVVLNIFSDL